MTTILQASGGADLLSLVPLLTGFRPQRSLVLLPFTGPRTCGALRLDLPPGPDALETTGDGAAGIDAFAATAIGMACRIPDVDAVAIIVYAEEEPMLGGVLPRADLVEQLSRRASMCGLRIVEALCSGNEEWADYRSPDDPPLPLSALPSAPRVPGVGAVDPDQRSGAVLPVVERGEKRAVRDAVRALDRSPGLRTVLFSPPPLDPARLTEALGIDGAVPFFERALVDASALSTAESAALIWMLDRPLLRDVALVQWARDESTGAAALTAQLEFDGDRSVFPTDIGEVILGRGPRPDGGRLRAALAIVRNAAAQAPRSHRGGALAAAAWLSWALGRSTHAGRYLDQAEAIGRVPPFGDLLRTLINAAVLPDWAFVRP